MQIAAGGQLGANTFGEGGAGQLDVTVTDSLALSGVSPIGASGLFAVGSLPGSGNSGQIEIDAGQLVMDQGAQILTNSFNQGAAGGLTISANQVSLSGTSEPIDIGDPTVPLVAAPTLIQSVQSGMGVLSEGQGGGVTIEATQVSVTEGAEISTGTFGPRDAGPLSIVAQEINVVGFSPIEGPSGILTTVNFGATGNGGALTLTADRLRALNGAQIASSTLGRGSAGDLSIDAETVQLSGRTAQGRSGLFATAIADRGAGGTLRINAASLLVDDGATVSVSNFPSSEASPVPPGQGAAGNLQVNAQQIVIQDQGLLSADTVAGDRSNITLQTELLALRRGSRITTNATGTATGGNINIEAQGYVIAVPDENSDITANAVFGDGGQVNISAQQILGLALQPELTAQSDITASSEFGTAGETRLETPDGEVRSVAEPLPQSTVVSSVLQGCIPGSSQAGRFVQSGRGGISTEPYGILDSQATLADVSVPSALPSALTSALAPSVSQAPDSLVEAQGWQMNHQGEVVLIAEISEDSVGTCSRL